MNIIKSNFPEWYKEIDNLGDPLSGISDCIDFGKNNIHTFRSL